MVLVSGYSALHMSGTVLSYYMFINVPPFAVLPTTLLSCPEEGTFLSPDVLHEFSAVCASSCLLVQRVGFHTEEYPGGLSAGRGHSNML